MPLLSTRSYWLLLPAALLLGGCVGVAEINGYPAGLEWDEPAGASEQDDVSDALPQAELAMETRFAAGTPEPGAEGLIIAPEVVTGYVGETLLLDLVLSNPDLGELRPASLPEEAIFEAYAGGASVEWVPETRDIGHHDFVFLVEDVNDPDLVLAQKTILVSVLPRFSLVEYGF